MANIRISAYTPEGKQVSKGINSNHYTPDEVSVIERAFKKWIHAGNSVKDFDVKNAIKKVSISDSKTEPISQIIHQPVGKTELFKRKHISSIVLPENGAMSWACLGSTRSGKTYAMSYLWDTIFKSYITFLMTLSGHADIYKPFTTNKNVIISDGYHKELIDEAMKINKLTKDKYPFCHIFDDLGMNGKISDTMTNLLTRGRNCNQSVLYCGQKLTMLSATGRTNINFVLCFYQNTDTEIETTIKTFLRSHFPKGMKLPEMISLYRELTKDHNFICIDTLNNDCFLSKI
jgi:hypothetical protein